MQLTPHTTGRVAGALGLMTANLFLATAAAAQDSALHSAGGAPAEATVANEVVNETGLTRVDSAVLFYQEAGGRVHATEPVVSMTLNDSDGDALSVKLTSDILTGATPNGAAPWKAVQTFVTPAQAPGSKTTVTGASGGSTIVTLPGSGTVTRQYTTPGQTLPVDAGFRDHRYALDLGYATSVTPDVRLALAGSASAERDYRSFSISPGGSWDLFDKNTTLSFGLNFEFDQSRPVSERRRL